MKAWLWITLISWVVFALIQINWSRVRQWLALHRVCAWCQGHMGGNPWVKNVTHGCCEPCLKREMEKIESLSKAQSPWDGFEPAGGAVPHLEISSTPNTGPQRFYRLHQSARKDRQELLTTKNAENRERKHR